MVQVWNVVRIKNKFDTLGTKESTDEQQNQPQEGQNKEDKMVTNKEGAEGAVGKEGSPLKES